MSADDREEDLGGLDGLQGKWTPSAVRDWVILPAICLVLIWMGGAFLLALRSRSTPFSRMWPSRALLALLGFLWPASFALTTAPFQSWLTSLSGVSPENQCRLFTVLVNGVFEPWFCLLLLLSVKLHWNGIAARLLSALTCGCRTPPPEDGRLSARGAMTASVVLVLPSVAYHTLWYRFSVLGAEWEPFVKVVQGPCEASLVHLLVASLYVVLVVLMLQHYASRLARLAINRALKRRVWRFRLFTSVALLLQVLLRFVFVVVRDLSHLANTAVFIAYFSVVVTVCMGTVYVLVIRPVLNDQKSSPKTWKSSPSREDAYLIERAPSNHNPLKPRRSVESASTEGGGGGGGKRVWEGSGAQQERGGRVFVVERERAGPADVVFPMAPPGPPSV